MKEDNSYNLWYDLNEHKTMKMKNWIIIGIGVVWWIIIFALIAKCKGYIDYKLSENEYIESTYEDEEDSNENGFAVDDTKTPPSWVQGRWYCVTPYGKLQVEISGDHILELLEDGTSYYGTYSYSDRTIHPNTKSYTHYKLDLSTQRIEAGQGYYFEKEE